MKGLALDSSNDIIVGKTSITRTDEGAHVVQKVRSRLLVIAGEYEDDEDEGIPYFSDIFTKPVNFPAVASLFKSRILGTEGVNELLSFDTEYDGATREYSLSFSVNTDYGEVSISDVTINI